MLYSRTAIIVAPTDNTAPEFLLAIFSLKLYARNDRYLSIEGPGQVFTKYSYAARIVRKRKFLPILMLEMLLAKVAGQWRGALTNQKLCHWRTGAEFANCARSRRCLLYTEATRGVAPRIQVRAVRRGPDHVGAHRRSPSMTRNAIVW